MARISNDKQVNLNLLYEMVEQNNISAVEVLDMITDWNGTDIWSKDFMENLRDVEGYEFNEESEEV